MARGSTLILRTALCAIGLVVLALGAYIFQGIFTGWNAEYPNLTHLRYPLLLIMALSAVPFYLAIAQAFKILGLIDRNKAFSGASVMALQTIMQCAFLFAGLYAASMYIVFQVAQVEDAPGLILIIGSIFVGAPTVFGVFMAVLKRVFQDAVTIKSENDLTV